MSQVDRSPLRKAQRVELAGWGNTAPSSSDLVSMIDRGALLEEVLHAPRGVLGRGLGRSYGDGAQNSGGTIADGTTNVGIEGFDAATGVVTAKSGTSLDQLMTWFVPMGWFVPVTPGTRQVTIGGAIAADIHGKNHHRSGSFCNHVLSFELLCGDGEIKTVTPQAMPELFWATAGGMGLTGLVLSAQIQMKPIETSRLLVDTDRASNLEHVMDLMVTGDDNYDYSVAWIDLMATGAHMGRAVLDRGRFARLDELPASAARDPLKFTSSTIATVPPGIPSGLLVPPAIKAFNELWFRKAPAQRRENCQTITQFFHPLDLLSDWNRMYGPRGFLQWQFVVPDEATETLRHTVEQLSSAGVASFLAVLKRFGPGSLGHLSFPQKGWTITLDIPIGNPELGGLLDRLDEEIVGVGGRIYLAKDSRTHPKHVPVMYPRLDEWREIRDRYDPQRRFQSDLSRRLHLIE